MKTIFSILIIGFGILFSNSFSLSKVKNSHNGRCTGSANCSACSNCSRCGHCSSGGTCGVCSGSSSGRSFYSASRSSKSSSKKRKTQSSIYYSNSERTSKNSRNKSISGVQSNKNSVSSTKIFDANGNPVSVHYLYAKNEIINIRKLPKSTAGILEKVKKGTRLEYLGKTGSWYKVKAPKSKKIGYVYSSTVK